MTDVVQITVNADGSVRAAVGTSRNTFSDGSEYENLMKAADWADSLVYNLEGDECG